MNPFNYVAILILSMCILNKTYAQKGINTPIINQDTLKASSLFIPDTIKKINEAITITESSNHSPRQASFYSAIIPGLGQAYNKKYWKVPIVYGGFYVISRVISFHNDKYNEIRRGLFAKIDEDESTEDIFLDNTIEQLESAVDDHRRERDYYSIIFFVWYMLNIVDAHVDAHLNEFNISEDLSLQVNPQINRLGTKTAYSGVSLSLRF